jgi:glyoxylase-like metal-dependent hydrolase (beta-lactamase superfamily II)
MGGRSTRVAIFIICLCASMMVITTHAQELMTGSEYTESVTGLTIGSFEVQTETLAPGLHAIFGAGGNVLASIGRQGVLVVDDQLESMVPKIQTAVRQLGGGNIDFVINTHWHYDHADGNVVLGSSGSWIVSHQNARDMMAADKRIDLLRAIVMQPAYPSVGLPVITYDSEMRLFFNDQEIDLRFYGPAHTAGDTAVFFPQKNVVHMGDVYHSARYPFIDTDHGGSLDGMIAFCEAVLMEGNQDSIIVPGHGPVSSYADLAAYVQMLRAVRQRLLGLIEKGGTLSEVLQSTPTAEWNDSRGDPTLFLTGAYSSLSTP